MFDVVTEDLESCKLILELAMGIRIKEIRWRENQKVIHNLPGKRGARLDFYVETEEGTVYDLELGDETSKIILNTKGTNDAEEDPTLISFLHYVENSSEEVLEESSDPRLKRLHEIIESIRSNAEMEAQYMKGITREREKIADAKAAGRKEQRSVKLKKQKSAGCSRLIFCLCRPFATAT